MGAGDCKPEESGNAALTLRKGWQRPDLGGGRGQRNICVSYAWGVTVTTSAIAIIEKIYPGHDLGAKDVLALAETFRASALHLLDAKPLSRQKSCAPYRLLAIHSIELYFNAYLLAGGHLAPAIRGMQHDLAKRADLVKEAGMVLRFKTVEHLRSLSANREYLVSRYGSPDTNGLSQLNRLQATVEEVREKVTRKLSDPVPLAKKTKTAARLGPASVALRA